MPTSRVRRVHELKVPPEGYISLSSGAKNFDVRVVAAEEYEEGDVACFREHSASPDRFTGRQVYREIVGVQKMDRGFVMLSLGKPYDNAVEAFAGEH